jgi:hypothetical protein
VHASKVYVKMPIKHRYACCLEFCDFLISFVHHLTFPRVFQVIYLFKILNVSTCQLFFVIGNIHVSILYTCIRVFRAVPTCFSFNATGLNVTRDAFHDTALVATSPMLLILNSK